MADVREELTIVARVRDRVSTGLGRITKRIAQFRKSGGAAFKAVGSMAVAAGGAVLGVAAGVTALAGAGALLTASVVVPLGRITSELIQQAVAAQELDAKFQIVFGEASMGARQFAEALAQGTGRSLQQTIESLATFQDTLVPLGFARDEAAELSKALTQAAQDLASFSDVSDRKAVEDLQSAIVGNTETVRKYGIVITEARISEELFNLGLDRTSAQLTETEKALARQILILDGMVDAMGTAQREAQSFSGQLRTINASIEDSRIDAGRALAEVAQQAIDDVGGVGVVTDFIDLLFRSVVAAGQELINTSANVFSAIRGAVNDLGGPDGVIERVGAVAKIVGGSLELLAAGLLQIIDGLRFATNATVSLMARFAGTSTREFEMALSVFAEGLSLVTKESSLAAGGIEKIAEGLNQLANAPVDLPPVVIDFAGPDGGALDLQNVLQGLRDQLAGAGGLAGATLKLDSALDTARMGSLRSFSNSLLDIAEGAKSASDSFRDFARSAARLLGNLALQSIFAPFFGVGVQGSLFANGGIVPGGGFYGGGAMPVKGYANGGPIFRGPHIGIIGEGSAPAEAAIPLPDGKNVPVKLMGGGGGGQTNVSLNVQALDARSVADLFARNGEALASVIAREFSRDRNFKSALTGGA